MESIYYVMSWLCHRTCRHCYESRFHPYRGEAEREVVRQAEENARRIIDHFPERMTYLDRDEVEKCGRVILAGGEILLDAVREPVLYPALSRLRGKYGREVELIVQTTGDILTDKHVVELLERGTDVISCAGMDEYHAGFETEQARQRLRDRLIPLFEKHGMTDAPREERVMGKHYYHLFGASPGSWIGKLWPRGRAWENSLTTASVKDNFCNAWSGGLNFLDYGRAGSEVSVDPEGNVYPCCIKTKAPVGNLLKDTLRSILAGAAGNPVYAAISKGQPERMGIAHGWSVEKFMERSRTTLPSGRAYQNLCIGCDAFHEEVLMGDGDGLVHIS